jgi:hypothetical protein
MCEVTLHARLINEIKRRITICEESRKVVSGLSKRVYAENVVELSAALRIAELHAPVAEQECPECADGEWPCDTAKALLDAYVPGWRG